MHNLGEGSSPSTFGELITKSPRNKIREMSQSLVNPVSMHLNFLI